MARYLLNYFCAQVAETSLIFERRDADSDTLGE
jgi:hypothetical protein